MRDLQECQAEVFRRSEQRINIRKRRRNRMFLSVIPLVVCITVFAMVSNQPTIGTSNPGGSTECTIGCAVSRIDVFGPGISLSNAEPSELLLIYNQLQAYEPESTKPPEDDSGAVYQYGDEAGYGLTDGTTAAVNEYTIILTMKDGRTMEYRLAGNVLWNRSTKETYLLTQEQLQELKELLGISQ